MLKELAHSLRPVLPDGVRRRLNRLGGYLAYPHETFPSIEGALSNLREWGFEPQVAIDVGAFRGEWTRLFREFFPGTRILMIEAQERKRGALETVAGELDGVSFEIALLGASDGEVVPFFEMETGSSVYEEQSGYDRERVQKTLRTLDAIVSALPSYQRPDFLKLDVQGYELEVLRGAEELLGTTEFVYLEASLIPINRGCPVISDVMKFMTERGFALLDFCSQIRRADGALWQTDLLFVSTRSRFLPKQELRL